ELKKLFIKSLSLFLVFNFTFVSSLKAEAVFVDSFSVASQETVPTGLAFNNDGTKMFVVGVVGDDVNEYTLSTGFDLTSTVTFVDNFSIASQENFPQSVTFNNDGTKMYVSGNSNGVNEYTLSTGFDLTSTVTFVDSFSVAGQESLPQDLAFNTDGTKMFVTGYDGDDVNEYTLSCGFQVTTSSSCGSSSSSSSDPTTDKDVIGSIDTQVQGSKRLAEQTTNSILDRIKHVRSQDTIDQASQDVNISFSNPDLTLASSLISMPKISNLNPFQGLQTDEWSTWTKADVTIGRIGDTSLSSVQDISIQGVSLGADKKIDDNKMYGVSLRFANDDTDIGNAGTNISTQSINLSVYGSRYLDNNTFMDGVVGAGYMQSDLVRKSGSNTLNGDREGNQIYGSIKFGKQIKQSQFNIAPYGKIHSSYTQLDGYSETGTDALKFDAIEIGTTSGSVGLEIDQLIQYQESSVKPRFKLEYAKEMGSESTQNMYFVSDTTTKYSYTSDKKERGVITAGIGFDFIHDNGVTLSTDFERKQNNENDAYGPFDSVFITANFLSRKESEYSLSFQGSEGELVSQLTASKTLGLINFDAQLENDFNTSANNQLSLSATYNF
ncbi:autotransporter outer membrane beta-barrel domain-containing protein, partial [Alphaproteobacteria bacterium]|nr:autotransporter outer membrane beta-barrel domain-containing protein [Alphaproteobacteria bacterium]